MCLIPGVPEMSEQPFNMLNSVTKPCKNYHSGSCWNTLADWQSQNYSYCQY